MSKAQQTQVKGFSLVETNADRTARVESLFAVKDCGTIYRSQSKPYSYTFGHNDWTKTDLTLSEIDSLGAEFIGNYNVSI
jgi:hypothetical protein